MDGEGSSKKARKPYTITKVRDRWSEEEHERFLDALLLFGSEWKKVEEFVGTKTVVQIRSHAQKYFLKVQKNGLMVHMPSPHSKRNHAYPFPQKSSDDDNLPLQASMARPSWDGKSMLGVEGDNGFGIADIFNQKFDLAGSSSTSWLIYDAPLKENQQSPYPVTPDFAEVYNLVASIIDPESTNSFELYMQKLKEMDPVTAKTALVMMKNLTHNLSSPDFEPLKRQLLTRDMKNKATAETSDATNKSCQCLN